jgi:hypothetical protein
VSTDVSKEYIASIFKVEERSMFRKKPAGKQSNYSAFHPLACWFLAELISSTLKMEAICFSETSVDTQRTTRRHIPEDDYSS